MGINKGYARQLPAADVILRLRRTHTLDEIGEMYGVKGEAVYMSLKRAGLTKPIRRAEDIPWRINREHMQRVPHRNLQIQGRIRGGETVSDPELRRYKRFTSFTLGNGAYVIGYDPEIAPEKSYDGRGGWFITKRHPKDDPDNIITYRDAQGRFRRFEELNPANARDFPELVDEMNRRHGMNKFDMG